VLEIYPAVPRPAVVEVNLEKRLVVVDASCVLEIYVDPRPLNVDVSCEDEI
jgi:hypothetical protein